MCHILAWTIAYLRVNISCPIVKGQTFVHMYGKEAESFDHNFLHFNWFEFMAQAIVEKVELVCSDFILDCSMVYNLISKKKAPVL